MVKVYQNIEIPGVDFNIHGEDRKNSKFWNEGKFENFIKPHLPKDCTDMSFVELGTNAGLFLRMASDMGFRDVVGVEKDKTPVEAGLKYRDLLGYKYKLLKRTLGGQFGESGNFNFDELPVADYTVLSTFHYYIDINTWVKYLDQLKNKTRYIIIVSRHVNQRHWRALSDLEDVRKYFSDWEEVGYIAPISKEGDPKPRNLWSICFKSKLDRVNIKDIKTRGNGEMYDAVQDLVKDVVNQDKVDPLKTKYYEVWVNRKKDKCNPKLIKKFVTDKTNLLLDIKKNGPRDPLIVQEDLKLSDGGHRLSIMKGLGYKSVIVRKV